MDTSSLLLAGVTGLISGFLICIPVGPINITIINEGAKRGFAWAAMIGIGAMASDLIYCSIAFIGSSRLFDSQTFKAVMELLGFVLMVWLGFKYLFAHDLPETTPTVEAVEHSLHPHTAFMIGFVRVLGNPTVLLFWITLAASFISHEWIEDTRPSKLACVGGVFIGGLSWFTLLSFLVSRGHGKFSRNTLVRMSHVSGASLLIVACFMFVRLVRLLSLTRHLR